MRAIKTVFRMMILVVVAQGCDDVGVSADTGGGTGTGGSMTRFSIRGDIMYVLNNSAIQVFRIGEDTFTEIGEVQVGNGMETIFASDSYLYLGARDAMFIYSIDEPSTPEFVFRYSHITSCDPVVVQGNRAYVTMRSGSECNLGANALEIIDITDPYAPVLLANYPMVSPHGLGIDGNLLFLCDGEAGFKVFDVTTVADIQQVYAIPGIHAYDVIALNGIAIITGDDGVFQYSYGTDGSLNSVSTIPVLRQ